MMERIHHHKHNRANYKLAILILLIVYHFGLFYSLSLEPANISDSHEYINSSLNYSISNNFYSGDQGEISDYRLFSKRTPFYPLLIYIFNKLNLSLNLIFILQIFIGLINIYISLKLLNIINHQHPIPLILYLFLVLLTPAQFIYSLLIMADIWLQFFVMLCLWSFAEFVKTKHSYWLVLIIISSTMAALTKPVFLYFSLFTAAATMYYFLVKSRHKILFLVSFLPILSWYSICKQNQINTSVFHYSSIGYINLLHYNTNLFLNKNIGKKETEKLLLPLMIVPESKEQFAENYKKVNNVCKQEIIKRPISYAVFHLRGVLYFFTDPGRFDIYNFLRIEKTNSDGFLHNGAGREKLKSLFSQNFSITILLIFIFIVNIFKSIGFLGYLWLHRKNHIAQAGAVLVFYIAILTGPLGASRFALPVQLIIITYAVCFFNSLRIKHKK